VARRAEPVLTVAIFSVQARPGCEGCLWQVEVDASGSLLPPFAEHALTHGIPRNGHVLSRSVRTCLTKAPARETGTCCCQQGRSERERWQPRHEQHAANGPRPEGTLPTEVITSDFHASRPLGPGRSAVSWPGAPPALTTSSDVFSSDIDAGHRERDETLPHPAPAGRADAP
jgi:hypothetical protein